MRNILLISSFIILAYCPNLWGLTQVADVEITYSVPSLRKQELFDTFIKQNLPGKNQPDNYSLRLALIKNVKPEDQQNLTNLLQTLANQNLASATFTPQQARVTSAPTPTIAFVPRGFEAANLILTNQTLFNALARYNLSQSSQYTFQTDSMPGVYNPSITVASRSDFASPQVKPILVAAKMNALMARNSFDVLHDPATPSAPTPASSGPTKLTKKAAKKAARDQARAAKQQAIAAKKAAKDQARTAKQQAIAAKKASKDQARAVKQQAKASKKAAKAQAKAAKQQSKAAKKEAKATKQGANATKQDATAAKPGATAAKPGKSSKHGIKPSKHAPKLSKWGRKYANKPAPPMPVSSLRKPPDHPPRVGIRDSKPRRRR